MLSVKVYDTDTGHVQTINEHLTQPEADKLLTSLNADRSTETVYYVSDEEFDWTKR